MLVATGPNELAYKLWSTTIRRSFKQSDGQRRLLDLWESMVPVIVEGEPRSMIYPGRHDRVLRVLRKIVRGLSHYHDVETAVTEDRVWVDVLKYQIPPELAEEVQFQHREPDVFQYWYEHCDPKEELSSVWLLKFFETRLFIAGVSGSDAPKCPAGLGTP